MRFEIVGLAASVGNRQHHAFAFWVDVSTAQHLVVNTLNGNLHIGTGLHLHHAWIDAPVSDHRRNHALQLHRFSLRGAHRGLHPLGSACGRD